MRNKALEDWNKIKVEGHKGTWGVIDTLLTNKYGILYLLEHETYGEDAPSLIVDADKKIILEDVWNGWEDYEESTVSL